MLRAAGGHRRTTPPRRHTGSRDTILGSDLAVKAQIATADYDRFSLSDVSLAAAPGRLGAALDLWLEKKAIAGVRLFNRLSMNMYGG